MFSKEAQRQWGPSMSSEVIGLLLLLLLPLVAPLLLLLLLVLRLGLVGPVLALALRHFGPSDCMPVLSSAPQDGDTVVVGPQPRTRANVQLAIATGQLDNA